MRFLKSLHSKLIFWIIVIGVVPVSVILPLFLYIYQSVSIQSETSSMASVAQYYSAEIVESGYLSGAEDELLAERLSALAESYNGRVVLINNALKVMRDTNKVDIGRIIVWENMVRAVRGETMRQYDDANELLIFTAPVSNSDGEIIGAIMLCKSCSYIKNNATAFAGYGIVVIVIIALICVSGAIIMASRLSRQLKKTDKALDDIMAGHQTVIPERKSYTELEQLEQKTNDVIGLLREMDESRQEFVSNVSHELKTPLTSMKVLADSLNSSEDIPIEMYKEFMKDIGSEIDRETKIINDLLDLVKLDKTNESLNIAPINMNELLELILKRLKPIADMADVKVILESFRPVNCEVDEVKITLAITNLVENAIKYNNPGGWVHVTLNSDHKYCFIKVKDNGLGIPEESVPYIFERFYRADKSHSREIGGTGLGLAITRSAVLMHRGDVRVASTLGEGTEFDIRIPLSYIVEGGENYVEDEE